MKSSPAPFPQIQTMTLSKGIDKVLAYWGKTVLFHSKDEYKAQWDQPLILKF